MISSKNFLPIDEFSDMWSVLTQEERMYLRENTTIQHYKRNKTIYSENDHPTHLICLITGKVKIYKEGVCGRNQIVKMIKQSESFGYRAFFANEIYRTCATAVDDTYAYLVPLTVIQDMIKANNRLALTFINILAQELGKSHNRVVNLTQKHIRGRLAEAIIDLINHYGFEEDGCTINIRLSREDLANISNMTTANAIRTLSGFAAENMLSIEGRRITVLNLEELTNISKAN